jgi:hypothetical protein
VKGRSDRRRYLGGERLGGMVPAQAGERSGGNGDDFSVPSVELAMDEGGHFSGEVAGEEFRASELERDQDRACGAAVGSDALESPERGRVEQATAADQGARSGKRLVARSTRRRSRARRSRERYENNRGAQSALRARAP